MKIHFRASDIVQICRGIARLSIITCSCKAKTGIAHSKMAMDDSGWFYNSSCLQDARLSGWSRHSSVEVREDKNCTCDHHANEHHTTKDKESTRARKTYFPTVHMGSRHFLYTPFVLVLKGGDSFC